MPFHLRAEHDVRTSAIDLSSDRPKIVGDEDVAAEICGFTAQVFRFFDNVRADELDLHVEIPFFLCYRQEALEKPAIRTAIAFLKQVVNRRTMPWFGDRYVPPSEFAPTSIAKILEGYGDGGRAKLAVNLILGLNRLALAEGLTFAGKMGLDQKAFIEVAKTSAAYSQVMETKGEKMRTREFSPEGRVKQTLKDVHMMLDQGKKLGQALPMLQVHCDVLESCVRAGEAERDNSIIVEEIRRRRRSTP